MRLAMKPAEGPKFNKQKNCRVESYTLLHITKCNPHHFNTTSSLLGYYSWISWSSVFGHEKKKKTFNDRNTFNFDRLNVLFFFSISSPAALHIDIFQKPLQALKSQELLNFHPSIKHTSFNVWVRYFVLNFKGYLWSTFWTQLFYSCSRIFFPESLNCLPTVKTILYILHAVHGHCDIFSTKYS